MTKSQNSEAHFSDYRWRLIGWAMSASKSRGTARDMPLRTRVQVYARAALLLGIGLMLTGCSSFRTEVGSPLREPSSPLVEGETRVETVVHELGPPHGVSSLPHGFVFLYEYSRVKEFQWGLSLKLVRLPYFKLVKGNSQLSESAQLFTFDDQGVLRAKGSAAWREELGGGEGLQLIVSVIGLTDTTAFHRPPDALLWGRGFLQRPAVALNSAQDPRTGRNGLQQRIAPRFVGQTSLEMSRPNLLKPGRQKTQR